MQGGSNFRPICGYISKRVLDRGIVTMEDQYKVCALLNSATVWPIDVIFASRVGRSSGATFDDLE